MTVWINIKDRLPLIEGYYKVRFDSGVEDEKPFRIRPSRNIHGFMSEVPITHWAELLTHEIY